MTCQAALYRFKKLEPPIGKLLPTPLKAVVLWGFNSFTTLRVFTFGIGSGASTELVRGLARAGNGTAEFIQEGERMQPKVISKL